MVTQDYKQEIIKRVEKMSEDQQKRVLDFVNTLLPKSISGAEFIKRTHGIFIDDESTQQMIDAIEEG